MSVNDKSAAKHMWRQSSTNNGVGGYVHRPSQRRGRPTVLCNTSRRRRLRVPCGCLHPSHGSWTASIQHAAHPTRTATTRPRSGVNTLAPSSGTQQRDGGKQQSEARHPVRKLPRCTHTRTTGKSLPPRKEESQERMQRSGEHAAQPDSSRPHRSSAASASHPSQPRHSQRATADADHCHGRPLTAPAPVSHGVHGAATGSSCISFRP
ncbi:hypothetical protein TcCL_NonESM06089, partial [Trypanosoma cruzi]